MVSAMLVEWTFLNKKYAFSPLQVRANSYILNSKRQVCFL